MNRFIWYGSYIALPYYVFKHMRSPSQAVEVLQANSGEQDPRLQSQRTQAFLSLARFSDFQYQTIDKYMRSSEFENKQVLLEKAKAEVDLMKEHNVDSNRSALTGESFCMARMSASMKTTTMITTGVGRHKHIHTSAFYSVKQCLKGPYYTTRCKCDLPLHVANVAYLSVIHQGGRSHL